jgi:2-polyprenyl-3-methyl-5-hydroxy-6-metoxy-1,4-benzoquinol methylase
MRSLIQCAVDSHPTAATLLDVGAAAGLLLREAKAAGLDAEGVEPSESLVRAARDDELKIHAGVLPHPALAQKHFDIVTLIDVIEHVADPVALLRDASAYLAPGGVIVTVTPDVGSLAARLLGQRWWHFRLAHVCYFNRRSLESAVASAHLKIRSRQRAKWYFEVGYLADRLCQYLPIGALNRAIRKTPGLRSLYDIVIPLNLGDSFLVVLERADA